VGIAPEIYVCDAANGARAEGAVHQGLNESGQLIYCAQGRAGG
jgi:hypothetical protein